MDYQSSQKPNVSTRLTSQVQGQGAELEGARVLILTGKFKGEEGVCLGHLTSADNLWAVSPDCASEILSLAFEKDFALVVDLSSESKLTPGFNALRNESE